MGGGITILSLKNYFSDKMKSNLYKIRPELTGKVGLGEINFKNFECPICQLQTIVGWEYELNGEIYQRPAGKICSSCGTKELSHEATTELYGKRVGKLISSWWHLANNETAGFKNFLPTNDCTQKAKETAIIYTQLFSQESLKEKNLLLMGNPGTGKTHLSKAIARTLTERGFKVGYITSVDLFNKIRDSYETKSTARLFQEMKEFDLLVIDDIGVETTKINDVSWAVKTWTEIIDARLGMANIWTTNLDDENLPKIVGKRAFSRMFENTRFIDLFTEDYRKRKVVNN